MHRRLPTPGADRPGSAHSRMMIQVVVVGTTLLLLSAGGAWAGFHRPAPPMAPKYLDVESERLFAAPPPTPAQQRDNEIDFWARRAIEDPESADALSRVAAVTLQRSRETGDFNDVLRAEDAARRSLARRDQRNGATRVLLASTLLAQHRFADALAVAQRLVRDNPGVPAYLAMRGETEMETGDYDAARATFDTVARMPASLSVMGRRARWAELTGHVAESRQILSRAIADVSAQVGTTPEQVAWFRLRLGDLEFRAGKLRRARDAYDAGLAAWPDDYRIHAALARLDAAQGRWADALAHGDRVLAVQLDPATLAVMGDAHAALGDTVSAAKSWRAMEVAVAGQPGAYHRAWSLFLLDHDRRVGDVVAAARAELETRHDVYGWDVYAWALHRHGDHQAARDAMVRALALHTPDALLYYHAGMIERALGHSAAAAQWLERALALNPAFDASHPAAARAVLDTLRAASAR